MTRAWSDLLVELPAVWDVGLRLTVVLLLAWGLHALLARCNPRWRVHLWRFTSLAIVLVVAATFLPRIAVSVDRRDAVEELPAPPSDPVVVSYDRPRAAGAWIDASQLPPVYDWSEPPLESFLPEADNEEFVTEEAAAASPAGAGAFLGNWLNGRGSWLFAAVWGVGALLLALRWATAQLRVRRLLARTDPAPKRSARLLRRVADQLDIFRDFDLRLSAETDVPFVTGLFRPVVVLPTRMAEAGFAGELPAIFAHELSHVKSRDLMWMGLSQWVTIGLWFHPLTWKLTTAHAMACEEVADGVAAGNVGDVTRYSGTLARVALAAVSHPPAAAAISMARSSQIMSRLARLKRGLTNAPVSRRWMIVAALAGLAVLIPVASVRLAYADKENDTAAVTADGGPGRVLHFPKGYSVGRLSIATAKESEWWDEQAKRFDYRRDWDWKYHGEAQGDVTVPADAKVFLEIKKPGARNTAWMKQLRPDDIYEIFVFPHPANEDPYTFGDAQLRNLSHLTGLRELTIQFVRVSGRGLRALNPLRQLEKLTFYSPNADNSCLRSIAELTSLESLLLGKGDWDDAGLAELATLTQLEEIHLPFSGVPGRGFDAVLRLPNLKYIAASMHFKDAHLAQLKKAKALRALNLQQNVNITDDGMRFIAQLPQLEYLDLWSTNITDAGVRQLGTLTSLKRLNINVKRRRNGPSITADSADAVAEMKALEILDVGIVGDVDRYLEKISGLEQLRRLSIAGHKDTGFLTDAGARQLAKFRNMERMSITGTNFRDAAVDHITQLSELKWLSLFSDSITDDGLAKLSALKQLRYLNILGHPRRGQMTFSGVSQLKGLPNLTALWYAAKPARPDEPPLDFSGMPALEQLGMSGLRNQDVASLTVCRNLKWLQGAELDNEGFAHLTAFPHMDRLYVAGGDFNDDALVYLSGMHEINSLTLNGPITEKGLPHIEKLKSLEKLSISTSAKFSEARLRQLRASLPNLRFFTFNQNRADEKLPQKRQLRYGQKAPPFEVTLIDGKEVSLKDYRGKVLLLYFWSTSCKPCVASMPKIKQAYAELSKYEDFAMLGLSGDDQVPAWKNFVQQNQLTWPQARIGDQSKMALAYGVAGYPRYIVIGRDGKILTSNSGEVDAALKKALEVDGE